MRVEVEISRDSSKDTMSFEDFCKKIISVNCNDYLPPATQSFFYKGKKLLFINIDKWFGTPNEYLAFISVLTDPSRLKAEQSGMMKEGDFGAEDSNLYFILREYAFTIADAEQEFGETDGYPCDAIHLSFHLND